MNTSIKTSTKISWMPFNPSLKLIQLLNHLQDFSTAALINFLLFFAFFALTFLSLMRRMIFFHFELDAQSCVRMCGHSETTKTNKKLCSTRNLCLKVTLKEK